MNIIVIGAGLFGISTALKLSKNHNVTLVESKHDIMLGASKNNHNRIHFGFHYPRSIKTAKQSLDGYDVFYNTFKDSIISEFPNYYMIDKNGKTTSEDYIKFCIDLELDIENKYPNLDIDFENIDSSFLTKEQIFDYNSIYLTLKNKLEKSNIKLILNKSINSKKDLIGYDVVINTTYSNINNIKNILGIKNNLLKMQFVMIPILKIDIDKIGITIMDGDYCSIMPMGNIKNNFLLYHVKESVLFQKKSYNSPFFWNFINKLLNINLFGNLISKKIIYKSSKYFEFLKNSKVIGYYKCIRCLPINDDDARVSEIEIDESNGVKVISILSGKVTTCFLIAEEIDKLI